MQQKAISPETFAQLLSNKFTIRFWSKIVIRAENECWLWTKGTNNRGYGQVNWGRKEGKLKMGLAHRTAWMIFHKAPIPEGKILLHTCNTPKCCNPNHLTVGTFLENTQQMDREGRRMNAPQLGSKHGMSKLTNEQVIEIRHLRRVQKVSNSVVAKLFSITPTNVSYIVNGHTWKHI